MIGNQAADQHLCFHICKNLVFSCNTERFASVLSIVIVVFPDAAYGLVQRKSQLFSLNSNNAILQFIVEVSMSFNDYYFRCTLLYPSFNEYP